VLTPDEVQQLGEGLASDAVSSVVEAALTLDPPQTELEKFVLDPQALPEARRAKVRALVNATWSPHFVDKLTRAPVAAAGRIVAAALRDEDREHKKELENLADQARPGDPDALVVAFAFLWRDLDDATLDEATAFFTSELGKRANTALVEAVTTSIDALAGEVVHAVQG
jgi:hypothetical protein